MKCNKLSIPLHLCTRSYVNLFCYTVFLSAFSASCGFEVVQCRIPGSGLDIQLQTATLFQHLLCEAPWHSLECRSLQVTDKAQWKRGGCFVCLKEVHAIKNSLPSCQCIAIKNSWAGLLSAFSRVQVDSPFVPLSCHNSPITALPLLSALCERYHGGKVSLIKRVHFGFTGLQWTLGTFFFVPSSINWRSLIGPCQSVSKDSLPKHFLLFALHTFSQFTHEGNQLHWLILRLPGYQQRYGGSANLIYENERRTKKINRCIFICVDSNRFRSIKLNISRLSDEPWQCFHSAVSYDTVELSVALGWVVWVYRQKKIHRSHPWCSCQ